MHASGSPQPRLPPVQPCCQGVLGVVARAGDGGARRRPQTSTGRGGGGKRIRPPRNPQPAQACCRSPPVAQPAPAGSSGCRRGPSGVRRQRRSPGGGLRRGPDSRLRPPQQLDREVHQKVTSAVYQKVTKAAGSGAAVHVLFLFVLVLSAATTA